MSGVNEWTDDQMSGVNEWTDDQMSVLRAYMLRYVERMNERMNERTNERVHGRTSLVCGDIVPNTDIERLVSTACMLIGGFMFGYIIGAVGNVITSRNLRHAEFCSDMLHLNQFLSEGRFEAPLKQKLREFFKWRHSLQDSSTNSNLLERMSPSLRGAAIKALDMWIDNVKILNMCPEDFVTHAIMRMERAHYPPGEVIVQAGNYDNAMYIVKQGLVVVGSATGGAILKTGGVWGEEMLYQRPPRISRGDYRPSGRPKKGGKQSLGDQGGGGAKAGPSRLAPRAAKAGIIKSSSSSSSSSNAANNASNKSNILNDYGDSAMDLAVYGLVRFSAHSLTYCELYTLTSRQVADLVSQFPEAKKVFRRAAICRIAREEIFAYCMSYRMLEDEMEQERSDTGTLGSSSEFRSRLNSPSTKNFTQKFMNSGNTSALQDRVDHYYWKLVAIQAFDREERHKLEAAVVKLQRRFKRWRVRAKMLGLLPSQQRDKMKQLEVTMENTPRVVFEVKADMQKMKPRVDEMSERLDQVVKQQEEILQLLRAKK